MELLLLKLLVFLRPLIFIDVNVRVLGLNLFEVAAIGITALAVGALMLKAALHKDVTLSSIDLLILAFTVWCIIIYFIYADKGDFKELAKLILPLLTYTVCRNVIPNMQSYQNIIFLMILGFTIPVLVSAAMIFLGEGLSYVSYSSGQERYGGVYTGAHNMSHNATLLIMLIILYVTMQRNSVGTLNNKIKYLFLILATSALYLLYAGRVRTAILGLIVFFTVYLFNYNKRLLILGFVGVLAMGIVFAPLVVPRFFFDVSQVSSGKWDTSQLGSGRPNIWKKKIKEYAELPVDGLIAGGGIGKEQLMKNKQFNADSKTYYNSHNDFLEILIETGIVGFILFMSIMIALLRAILRLPVEMRSVILAIYAAVMVMNFVSASYVTRFGLAQMFYIIVAYVGIRQRPLQIIAPK